MSERTPPNRRLSDQESEYLKFAGLLVVMLVAILILAVLSPRLIGRGAAAVLGLDGRPETLPQQALEAAPVAEPVDTLAPEALTGPEGEGATSGAAASDVENGAAGLRHEVLEGQTLFQIAEQYGVTVQEIAAANNLVNPRELEAGSILVIPQGR